MKTNTFETRLDEILDNTCAKLGLNDWRHVTKHTKQAIIDLVLNDVIGENERSKGLSGSFNVEKARLARNKFRSEQRAIIKGGNNED